MHNTFQSFSKPKCPPQLSYISCTLKAGPRTPPPAQTCPRSRQEVTNQGESAIDPMVETWGICVHCVFAEASCDFGATRSSAANSMSQLVAACVLW